jgi:hypothetical protein
MSLVQDGNYTSTTFNVDDSTKTLNLRLDAFDVSMNNIQQVEYDLSSVVHTIDFSATGVIFVKTEDMRTTFQFAVDADHLTDVGVSGESDAGIRYYVFDASMSDASKNDLSFAPTWKWDVSAADTDASYIIQPAHAMMDASGDKVGHQSDNMIAFSIPTKFNPAGDDGNIREDKLVKQDFVRHIAKTALGGADLTGLFSNVDDLLLSIENGGVTAWDTIRTNLAAARDENPLTNDETDLTKNPTRALYRQLVDRNPDRFDASGNDNGVYKNKIINTPNPQPLPFIDGDILEFTFKVSSNAVNVPDVTNDVSQVLVPTRTYRIKMCLVDGSGNNGEYNVKPPSYVYDLGTSAYGLVAPNNKEGSKVTALAQHRRYYEMDMSGSGSGGGDDGGDDDGDGGGGAISPVLGNIAVQSGGSPNTYKIVLPAHNSAFNSTFNTIYTNSNSSPNTTNTTPFDISHAISNYAYDQATSTITFSSYMVSANIFRGIYFQ